MLASVRASANGSPWPRVKPARTVSRLVIDCLRHLGSAFWGTEIGGALSAAASGHRGLFFAGQLLKETLAARHSRGSC